MARPERKDVAVGFGLVGLLTALALVAFGDTRILDATWTGQIGVVIIAGPSAWLAGMACGWMFGRPKAEGWVLAFLGACLSTMLGAAIGGNIVFPILGTIMAPSAILDEAIAHPMIIIVWLALMASMHVILLKTNG
jgi:hypothetical protein